MFVSFRQGHVCVGNIGDLTHLTEPFVEIWCFVMCDGFSFRPVATRQRRRREGGKLVTEDSGAAACWTLVTNGFWG